MLRYSTLSFLLKSGIILKPSLLFCWCLGCKARDRANAHAQKMPRRSILNLFTYRFLKVHNPSTTPPAPSRLLTLCSSPDLLVSRDALVLGKICISIQETTLAAPPATTTQDGLPARTRQKGKLKYCSRRHYILFSIFIRFTECWE